jgi:hypothetical protein
MVLNSVKTSQVLSLHSYCVGGALHILCHSTFIVDRSKVEFEAFTVTEYFDVFLGYQPCQYGSTVIHRKKW